MLFLLILCNSTVTGTEDPDSTEGPVSDSASMTGTLNQIFNANLLENCAQIIVSSVKDDVKIFLSELSKLKPTLQRW